jgi:hypothetical protein
LSVIALLMVLSGYFQAPQPDEGPAARIFQLSIVALLPVGILFLATADWRKGARGLRPLIVPAVAVALAFAGLYHWNIGTRDSRRSTRLIFKDFSSSESPGTWPETRARHL